MKRTIIAAAALLVVAALAAPAGAEESGTGAEESGTGAEVPCERDSGDVDSPPCPQEDEMTYWVMSRGERREIGSSPVTGIEARTVTDQDRASTLMQGEIRLVLILKDGGEIHVSADASVAEAHNIPIW